MTVADKARQLQRAVDTVAGIAQAGNDVGGLVEVVVDGAGIDMHIGIFLGQRLEALGGRDDAQHADVLDTALAQIADSHLGRTARGEHGIDDQADTLVDILGHLAVILMWFVGDLVALHANVAHAGRGHQVEDAVDHAKTCTQDGDDGELLAGKMLKRGGSDGSLDFDILHGQIAHGLVAVKERELAYELAELVGSGALVAQDRQASRGTHRR